MDSRLAAYLCDQAQRTDGVIHTTHRAIATELGTSREVVSRLLKDFSHEGLIISERRAIEVVDASALQQKSEKK